MGRPKKQVAIEPLEINETIPIVEFPVTNESLESLEKSEEDTFEEEIQPVKKIRKKMNLTDEEREKRRLRLRQNNEKYLAEKKQKKIELQHEEEENKKRIQNEIQDIKDDLVIKKAKKVIDKKIKVSKKLQKILELSDDDEPVKKVEVKVEPTIEVPVKKQRKPRVQRESILETSSYQPESIINFL
jgi:hypothetical protein